VDVFSGVCLFVCQHDNFRTIKRRMIKLGGYVHCTKISPEFEFWVIGPASGSPHPKMWWFAESLHKVGKNQKTDIGVAVGHATTSVSK